MPPAEELYAENCSLKDENAQLRSQIAWLKKRLFSTGQSERIDPAQLELMLGRLEKLQKENTTVVAEHERKQRDKQPSREERYEHLPVEDTQEIIPERVQQNPEAYERLNSAEETFEVDYHPPRFFRRKLVRPKFRLKADLSLPPVIAPAPVRIVEGLASPGLLAHIMVGKFEDHLPLYRQAKIFKRQGCPLSAQSMVRWVEKVADWLGPIYNYMGQVLLEGDYLQADETPITFCDPDLALKKSKTGYFCAYSRPGGDVLFVWKTSRSADAVTDFIKSYKGLLQTDAYAPYITLAKGNDDITLVGCMAHARRYFVDAQQSSPREAALVLKLIAKLYAVEKQIREAKTTFTKTQIEDLRQEQATDTLTRLKRLMLIIQGRSTPQQPIRKAVNYTLAHWDSLVAYCQHGQVHIDNNLIENAIRPTALGKKNWMFIGHPKAGQRSATIYSILISCKIHQVQPVEYLKHVLAQDTADQKNVKNLTPAAFAQSISRG